MNISRIARGRPRRHPRHKHLCTPLLCLLLAALLLGCGGAGNTDTDPTACLRAPFAATVRGALDGLAFEAEICHTVTDGQDALALTFTTPAALEGITLSRQGGEMALSLGEIRLPREDGAEGMAVVLWLFSPDGRVLSVEKNRELGETSAVLTAEGGEARTLTFDTASGAPRFAESDGVWVEVLTFQEDETEDFQNTK